MDFLKDLALCLIAAAAAGTVATVFVPKGSADKTVRAVVGIFVVAVICSPLLEIGKEDLGVDALAAFDESGFDAYNAEGVNDAVIRTFKKTVENRLKAISTELGFEIKSVNADITIDAAHCINIQKIEVVISGDGFCDVSVLSHETGERLGIPVDVIQE